MKLVYFNTSDATGKLLYELLLLIEVTRISLAPVHLYNAIT